MNAGHLIVSFSETPALAGVSPFECGPLVHALNETSNREARSGFRTGGQQAGSGSSIRGLAPTGTPRNVIQSSRVVVPVLRRM
jgi:hypothetical protein